METPPKPTDAKRHTSADEIFTHLKNEIISLKILPGTKLSEAEVAKKFDLSRQPVREAFQRLGDLGLLEIRPQKATLVKKISLREIAHTRFVRLALEVEVVRVASEVASDEAIAALWQNLSQQVQARASNEPRRIQELDYVFHRLICEAAKQPNAFDVIAEYKAHTDRVCTVEMSDDKGMEETIDGHTGIVRALAEKNPEQAVKAARDHLRHLDTTIESALVSHPEYFEL